MTFCFKKDESVSKAIRRLGCDRIDSAIKGLESGRPAVAIHEARKDIKKVRAVLRLVRGEISRKRYRQVRRRLREAANHLAPSRDATVNVQTLGKLTAEFRGQRESAREFLRRVRALLQHAAADETGRFAKDKTGETVQRVLQELAEQLGRLQVKGRGWAALEPGVRATYSRGRRAYRLALREPLPGNFHEWRKRAKDLWYQVGLLSPMSPRPMHAIAAELEKLGEYLGDDHDLVMLRVAVEAQFAGDGKARELDSLRELIERRQHKLRAAARALGARLYAEPPAVFCERMAEHWRTWQARKKPVRRASGTKP